MLDEQIECEQNVKASTLFQEALERLGIDDVELVMVDCWSPGNFGFEEEQIIKAYLKFGNVFFNR